MFCMYDSKSSHSNSEGEPMLLIQYMCVQIKQQLGVQKKALSSDLRKK